MECRRLQCYVFPDTNDEILLVNRLSKNLGELLDNIDRVLPQKKIKKQCSY